MSRLPAPVLCPGVPWKETVPPGRGRHGRRCAPQVAAAHFSVGSRVNGEDCGKPRCRAGGNVSKSVIPLTPPRKGPSPDAGLFALAFIQYIPRQKHPGRSLPRPRGWHHLRGGGRGAEEPLRCGHPAEAAGRARPGLASPGCSIPAEPRPLCRSLAAAAAASTDRGASGCTGKFV